MIDIGNELADYGDQDPAEQPRLPGFVRERRGGGVSIRLADLQAQGFNRTPPPGYRAWRVAKDFDDRLRQVLGTTHWESSNGTAADNYWPRAVPSADDEVP